MFGAHIPKHGVVVVVVKTGCVRFLVSELVRRDADRVWDEYHSKKWVVDHIPVLVHPRLAMMMQILESVSRHRQCSWDAAAADDDDREERFLHCFDNLFPQRSCSKNRFSCDDACFVDEDDVDDGRVWSMPVASHELEPVIQLPVSHHDDWSTCHRGAMLRWFSVVSWHANEKISNFHIQIYNAGSVDPSPLTSLL